MTSPAPPAASVWTAETEAQTKRTVADLRGDMGLIERISSRELKEVVIAKREKIERYLTLSVELGQVER